jgi:kumamolisin
VAEARVALAGTERQAVPDARPLGAVDPTEPMEVSVLVRPKASAESLDERLARGAPPLSREEFAAQYGASADDLAAVQQFAQSHGLQVVEADAARRTVVLRGSAAAMDSAFGVQLQRFAAADGSTFQSHDGPIYVAPELNGVVQTVLGLDTRPAAQTPPNR